MSTKKVLTDEGKKFVVMSLAVFDTPSDVVDAVREKYGVKITRQSIQFYDPTKVAGRELSDELRELFFKTREDYDKEAENNLPLLKRHNRVKKLSRYVENAENMGNEIGAAALIEQIAKEEGGMFTNRRELTGANGADLSQPFAEVFDKFLNKAYGNTSDDSETQ